MRATAGTHLTPDEIVERVFPSDDRPEAVPEHLAACAICQSRVARLREAWLLDRGAVSGVVDSIPSAFWEAQREAIRARVEADEAEARTRVAPRPSPPSRNTFLRHPVVAAGSLAAAMVLVAGITVSRLNAPKPAGRVAASGPPPVAAVSSADHADEELLLSIDGILAQEAPFASLVPEEGL